MLNIFSTSFISNIIIFAGVIVAVIYIFSRVRQQDLRILRDANTDLRSSIDDKTKEIASLEVHVKMLEDQVNIMQTKVDLLEKQNGDLSQLVREALVMYFGANPSIATALQTK